MHRSEKHASLFSQSFKEVNESFKIVFLNFKKTKTKESDTE
jgi:hypothetical protein